MTTTLRKLVLGQEELPLSDADLRGFTGSEHSHILGYSELRGKDREWLLGKGGQYILLYEFPGKDVGHWVCGWATGDGWVHHFDPYGKPPDYYTDDRRYSEILGPKVTWNKIDFQKKVGKVDTCGRHCLVRLLFRDHTDQDYGSLVRGASGPDEVVTLMTLSTTLKHLR